MLLQVTHSNIPEDVIADAAEAYQQIQTDYTENRKLINKSNMWKLIHQFWAWHLRPLDMHPERILYYMMQSNEYMPDAKFLATPNGFGVPIHSARSMWYMTRHPQSITMDLIWRVFHFERGLSWQHYYCNILNDPYDGVTIKDAMEAARQERQNGQPLRGIQNDTLGGRLMHEWGDNDTYESSVAPDSDGEASVEQPQSS